MATLIIPDNTPLAELDRLARSMGKRLQYRAEAGQQPTPEDVPNGHHRHVTDSQPDRVLADQHSNH